jgi:gas vesicle protein
MLLNDRGLARKEEMTMETDKTNYSGLWKGLMVGSFLGVAAGFLLAPKSGKELMSEIKEKTDKAVGETRRFYSDGRTRLKDTVARFSGRKERASVRHIESPEEIVADA